MKFKNKFTKGSKLNLYFQRQNVIFQIVPKVANTSIKHRLFKIYDKVDLNENQIHRYGINYSKDFVFNKKNDGKVFIFAFVRNPYSRIVSLYNNKIARKNKSLKGIKRHHPDIFLNMPFDDFIEIIYNDIIKNNQKTDLHIRPQHTFVYHKNVRLPDYLGYYETLEKDWQIISEKHLNIDYTPLNKINSSNYLHSTYKNYYENKHTRDRVYEIYKEDFNKFGYRYEF